MCYLKIICDLKKGQTKHSSLKQNLISLLLAALLPNSPPPSFFFLQTGFHPQLPLSASQEAMRETAERLTEMEKALRASMNTSAHREALWAQEESARVEAQRQVDMH